MQQSLCLKNILLHRVIFVLFTIQAFDKEPHWSLLKELFIQVKLLRHLMGKPTMWVSNRSDTNQTVQLQKQARSLKFWS